METVPQTPPQLIVEYMLDGRYYRLHTIDGLTQEQTFDLLKESFPDIEILPEQGTYSGEDGR